MDTARFDRWELIIAADGWYFWPVYDCNDHEEWLSPTVIRSLEGDMRTLNKLTEEEIAEAKRQWGVDTITCIASMIDNDWKPAKGEEYEFDEDDWLAYCKWAMKEYGSDPFAG